MVFIYSFYGIIGIEVLTMAKRKEEKDDKKKGSGVSAEISGLIIILIAVIGIGRFGLVGNIISSFAIFLSGTLYNGVLFLTLLTGVYTLFKRKSPDFKNPRLIGLYILLISSLVLAHKGYITAQSNVGDIIGNTIDNMLLSFKNAQDITAGGGFVGALFGILLFKLFAEGSAVVTGVFILFGVIMLFNVSLGDMVKFVGRGFKNFGKLFKKKQVGYEEHDTKDGKVVISSLKDLKKSNEESVEMTKDEESLVRSPLENIIDHQNIYTLPPLNLMNLPKGDQSKLNHGYVKNNIEVFKRVFNDFEIDGKITEVHIGPSVTQYEVELKSGTKVNRILSINREMALALAAKDVRIQAPIPGKSTIGIEIPNRVNTPVSLREVIGDVPESYNKSKLLVGLGKDIMGKCIFAEIDKTPHLLVAGATGSGKSVCINTIIASILMRSKPDEVKLLLVDPKKVELSLYNGVPHLLAPVVTDSRKASLALMKIVSEMESRYNLFTDTKTKNIQQYNEYVEQRNKEGNQIDKMPYIVVIIDELADLMMVAAKEVEDSIMRITQMARASGIHLIVATQRPSTDVVTGIIKANIPSRISFAVSSNVDSRTILDMGGAEKLLGKGDMLFLPMGENIPVRVQGSFIHEDELKRIIDFTIKQQKAKYDSKLLELEARQAPPESDDEEYEDPLYNEVVEFAVKSGKISASLIQRKYRLGYNRAARIIDLLEERGVIGPSNGSKPREVLVKLEEQEDENY